MLDYRGFADSSGFPTEGGINTDASAALAWLGTRGVAPGRVVVWGHSLGTGPTVALAARQEQRGCPLCGVILESACTLARARTPRTGPCARPPWRALTSTRELKRLRTGCGASSAPADSFCKSTGLAVLWCPTAFSCAHQTAVRALVCGQTSP